MTMREQLDDPKRPLSVTVDTTKAISELPPKQRHAYSAIFAEVQSIQRPAKCACDGYPECSPSAESSTRSRHAASSSAE
jgi:hypothetical protein